MRWVRTVVLPDPAPATTNSGLLVCVTACFCCGFRWFSLGREVFVAVMFPISHIFLFKLFFGLVKVLHKKLWNQIFSWFHNFLFRIKMLFLSLAVFVKEHA